MECKFFCPKCAYIVTLAIIMYVGWKLVLFFSDCQCQDIMCTSAKRLIRTGVPPSFWQLKNWFPKDVCQKHISSSAQTEGQICAKLQQSSWGITLLKIRQLERTEEERVSFEILSTHSVCLAKFSIFGASFQYTTQRWFSSPKWVDRKHWLTLGLLGNSLGGKHAWQHQASGKARQSKYDE